MHNLNPLDVFEGNAVKLGDEGWAILIEPSGPPLSVEENEKLYIKQRWLVEFLSVKKLNITLNPEERITQSIQSGKRTHRYLLYETKEIFTTDETMRDDSDKQADDFDGLF